MLISLVKQNGATTAPQPIDLSHLKERAQQQHTTGCAFEPKQCVSKYATAYCNSKQLCESTIEHIVNYFPQPAPKRQSLVHQGKKPTHLLQLFLNLPPIKHIFIRQEDTQKILNFFPKGGKKHCFHGDVPKEKSNQAAISRVTLKIYWFISTQCWNQSPHTASNTYNLSILTRRQTAGGQLFSCLSSHTLMGASDSY